MHDVLIVGSGNAALNQKCLHACECAKSHEFAVDTHHTKTKVSLETHTNFIVFTVFAYIYKKLLITPISVGLRPHFLLLG
ncbi:hypothetical protein F903_01834 [Acinetobacter sp. NIPH 298]|nr:hypothetical protein F903_01834 [Acinetobacter sp. NIPH 298]MDR7015134.1 hypothetical protein [Prolinoborus sp. 3657]